MASSQKIDPSTAKQQVMLMVQSGRFAEANILCAELCKKHPDDAEAWFLLAAISGQLGNFSDAEKHSNNAARLAPENPAAHYNLAFAQYRQGKLGKAESTYKKTLELNPEFAPAHHDFANLLMETGRQRLAITHYRRAIKSNPSFAQAHYNLGRALDQEGQTDAAIAHYREASQLLPNFAEAHFRLGNSLASAGEHNKAIEAFKAAIAANNNYAEAYNNLGNTLKESGRLEEAIEAFQKAISIKGEFPEGVFNLATALQANGLLKEAELTYKKALSIKPLPQAANNLGNLLVVQGRIEEAEEYYRNAIELDPSYAEAHSNLLFCLNYKPGANLDAIYQEHRQWEKQHAVSAVQDVHLNTPDPERVIVVGYLSPDFREHSVAYFIEALLSSHDRKNFKIICYSDAKVPDETTERLQNMADVWRHTTNIPDDELAALINHDCIDILVDLAGHTQGNRLVLFSGKPAPIQISYIGYPNTTGLSSIDYRITDLIADPVDSLERYAEKLLRVPHCFLCYTPPQFQDPPMISQLPAKSNGYITFGSFNNLAKLNTEVVKLWSMLLEAVPDSHLVLKNKVLVDKLIHQQYIKMFRKYGIDENRLELVSRTHSTHDHLLLYNQIDIALDTFPYNGTTTTCEALWMGVPVISLAGNRHASRVGHSLLCNAGLPDLVASSDAEFIQIGVAMASNITHLSIMRENLRERLLNSTLCSKNKYCSDVESLYRTVWKDWCRAIPHNSHL